MSLLLAVLALSAFSFSTSFMLDPSLKDLKLLEETAARRIFDKFWTHHEREYEHESQEFENRFQVFWANMKFVAAHNQKGKTWEVALNHLADLTTAEVHSQKMGLRPPSSQRKSLVSIPLPGPRDEINATLDPFPRSTPGHAECGYRLAKVEPPAEVDWREAGVVTPVKDQMQCGSCWAYATMCAVESISAIKTGNLVELSEQLPTDCNWMSNPCVGGNMEEGYKWLVSNGAMSTAEYPYASHKKNQACEQKSWYRKTTVQIDTYEMIPEGEENLKKAVAIQPVSIGIDASSKEFLFYSSGIFDHSPCNDTEQGLTHAITAVGYKNPTEGERGYWIVRNQWADVWGEKGYMRLAMNRGKVGLCGIARLASRPVMDGEDDFHLYSHLPEWALEARRQVVKNMEADQNMKETGVEDKIEDNVKEFIADVGQSAVKLARKVLG
eukprot:CAMPEP_0196579216 /NCGR_PEP_ID=MMETSP1081-20130531/19153_1 /TAXON_ID=36882 /ORGANISM="Pyramimonas amylifera, Strain CCMP720" /LENGTH=439 /DNA_ID=CAMNT_0041898721 /DNA_START=105 /DNA_END=1424 /DNA_ORIENTATION=-